MKQIKITSKDGVTLHTANKYVDDDLSITIDESLLGTPEPTTALEHYRMFRPKDWPYIPLPSEIDDEDDVIYILCDKLYNVYSTNAFSINSNNVAECYIYKYLDTKLISEEKRDLINYQGTYQRNYFEFTNKDEDWENYNFIVYKIKAPQITMVDFYASHKLYNELMYTNIEHSCLEISGKCKKCEVKSLGTNSNGTRLERLKYFSFKGDIHTTVSSFFYNCSELIGCPELDEINSGSKQNDNFDTIFYYCKKILFPPNVNTSNCIRGDSAFSTSNIKIPNVDLTNVTAGSYLFEKYNKIPEEFDLTKISNYKYLFYNAPFSDEEFRKLDNLHITKAKCDDFICNCVNLLKAPLLIFDVPCSVSNFFSYCENLIEVPEIDMSNVTSLSKSFYNCRLLQKMRAKNIKVSFSLNSCKFLEHDELVIILNNLATVETTQTLTLSSTNLAKLTDEDIAIAQNKGWSIA